MSTRRAWSKQEDDTIRDLVKRYGHKNWANIAIQLSDKFGGLPRSGKQCRERWHNHLNPGIEKKVWDKSEEQKLFSLHKSFGNKWTVIAQSLPGRTDNSIKNYFYSTIRRSLRRMGKFVGSKNSTQQMKLIKPSTLSKIFEASSDPLPDNNLGKKEKELMMFIRQNCEIVRDSIVLFTNFKPKKSDKAKENQKLKFEEVIKKMVRINQIYQNIRDEKKIKQDEDSQLNFRHQSLSDDPSNNAQQIPQRVTNQKIVQAREVKKNSSEIKVEQGSELKGEDRCKVETVIIKSKNDLEEREINGDPEFFIQLKEQVHDLLPNFNSNLTPNGFFTPASYLGYSFFPSPSTPRSEYSSSSLGSIHNHGLNDFTVSLQKQIVNNLNGKMSSSNSTISYSSSSAFSFCNNLQ